MIMQVTIILMCFILNFEPVFWAIDTILMHLECFFYTYHRSYSTKCCLIKKIERQNIPGMDARWFRRGGQDADQLPGVG